MALREPADPAARQGLSAAEDAIAERHRLADEALAAAVEALEDGRAEEARAFTDAGLAAGADPERVHALLDQLNPPRSARSRFAIFRESEPSDTPTHESAAHRASRRRSAFALACALTFVGLGAGVGVLWERAMMRLAAPPVPRMTAPPAPGAAATVMSDGTIAEARRLLDAGDAAGAVAVLDRVQPAEPAYPFARQLRAQAERALPPPVAQ